MHLKIKLLWVQPLKIKKLFYSPFLSHILIECLPFVLTCSYSLFLHLLVTVISQIFVVFYFHLRLCCLYSWYIDVEDMGIHGFFLVDMVEGEEKGLNIFGLDSGRGYLL
jgi:hypothetical protein